MPIAEQDREQLTTSLQESMITLLAFDDKHGRIAAGLLKPSLFDQPYRRIAEKTLEYRTRFSRAPGLAHIDDLFDSYLEGANTQEATLFRQLLGSMAAQAQQGLNGEYILGRITEFIRRQTLKDGVLKAADRYQQGGDDVADSVERILQSALKERAAAQNPGTRLSNVSKGLDYLDNPQEVYRLGIKELDRRGIGPTRKEMLVYIAPRKRGKTWFLIHCGKMARLQRAKVLHVTLEMSESKVTQRYHQAFWGVAKRADKVPLTELDLDEFGNLSDVRQTFMPPKLNFGDPNIRKKLARHIREAGTMLNGIIVKDFPSGSLSVEGYLSYLDYLEQVERFIPDVVLLDYPDLMTVDPKNLRVSLGQIYVRLRGAAAERNHALVVVTQGNRESSSARVVDESHVAEDISKIATADAVLTYSQTKEEHKLNLARLFVSNARNDEDRFTTLISQSYATGQFALASAPQNTNYNTILRRLAGTGDGDDDE